MTAWRPVFGWENDYSVSDAGVVIRTTRGRGTYPGRVLSTRLDRKGYLYVSLPGKRVSRIHRLVATSFLGNQPGLLVRHLDGDPLNNTLANLAWGTAQDNTDDRIRHGRKSGGYQYATHCKHGHEFTEENTVVRRYTNRNPARRCRTCAAAWAKEHPRLRLE